MHTYKQGTGHDGARTCGRACVPTPVMRGTSTAVSAAPTTTTCSTRGSLPPLSRTDKMTAIECDTVGLDGLIPTYFATRKNKRGSSDSVEFELHWQRNLLRLADSINNRTLQPAAYSFVVSRPRPREVFACDFGMRIVHYYIDIRLRPLIERRLTKRTYNNRRGMGLGAAINQLAEDIYCKSCGFTKDAWCITWDLQGYFPNAVQDIVFSQFSDIIRKDYNDQDADTLLYLVERSIFSYPTEHCDIRSTPEQRRLIPAEKSLFSKPPGIGGAIGHLIWQSAMNLYISSIDKWLQEECGLLHVRYVDDNHVVTDNKRAFLSYIFPELRRRYAEYGCQMHPRKFYCQHYTKGVKFCGTVVKMQRMYVGRKVADNFRACVTRMNRRVSLRAVNSLLASVNSYLGICKTRNGHHIAMTTIGKLSPKWYRYVHLDQRRMCLVANDGYTQNERLQKKYKLRLKKRKHEKRREDRRAQAS